MDEAKCFRFKILTTNRLEGVVYAKDREKAMEYLYAKKWDDLIDGEIDEVLDIEELEEEE